VGKALKCKWSKAGADSLPGFGTEFDWPRAEDPADASNAVGGTDDTQIADGAQEAEGQSFQYPPMDQGDGAFGYPPMDQGDSMEYPHPPMNEGDGSFEYPPMNGGDAQFGYPPMDQGADTMGIPEQLSVFDNVRLFTMESDLSTRDIFLIVLLAISGVHGLYQLYRCCVNWKLHREYKLVNTSDRPPRPSHCIIDGQAYF